MKQLFYYHTSEKREENGGGFYIFLSFGRGVEMYPKIQRHM